MKSVETAGLGRGWIDGDLGHGPAYQFETPEGHKMEIFYEVEYYEASEEKRSRKSTSGSDSGRTWSSTTAARAAPGLA